MGRFDILSQKIDGQIYQREGIYFITEFKLEICTVILITANYAREIHKQDTCTTVRAIAKKE